MLSTDDISEILGSQTMRCVLVFDIVESVRLMARDEGPVISRWLSIVEFAKGWMTENRHGRLVKSLGDGMLLEFDDIYAAVKLAFAVQGLTKEINATLDPEDRIYLRAGLENSSIYVGPDDIYGHGVNVAALITRLGNPGDVICTVGVRSELTDRLDAEVEDLGECYLKHISLPVRAFRLHPVGASREKVQITQSAKLLPALAVVLEPGGSNDVAGEFIAEELVRALSRTTNLTVITSLSSRAIARPDMDVAEIAARLGADFVLAAKTSGDGSAPDLSADLFDVKSGTTLWTDRKPVTPDRIATQAMPLIAEIVGSVDKAIQLHQQRRVESMPLSTIESFGLLLASISSMYRTSEIEFERARQILEYLHDREPHHALPMAWLAYWHVLRSNQGMSRNKPQDTEAARRWSGRALDADPNSDVALTFDGLVHTHLTHEFDIAAENYRRAIAINPNAALATLSTGMLHAYKAEGDAAVAMCLRAQALSPADPQKFVYDSLTAGAFVVAGRYEDGELWARQSLRLNALHTSTLRTLAIALWQQGKEAEARETVTKLTVLEPNLSVSRWVEHNPIGASAKGRELAAILRAAGLPD